ITEAVGFAETDNQEILDAREKYQELYKKHKKEVEEKAQAVKAAGGLFILGTERHESRRIDNQLRGRAGRQGDEGESRFFIALEDDLMRLFGGERLQNIMATLNVDEDTPIESGLLTKVIESSQKKVEGRNFGIRKNVLKYDDVMSAQREIIYGQRAKVLDGEDIHDVIIKMIKDNITDNAMQYMLDENIHDEWNLKGLRDHFMGFITSGDDFNYSVEELGKAKREDIIEELTTRALGIYDNREKEFGKELLREIERVMLLKVVDTKWMSHIDNMEELRKGIGLRAYGQKDPVVEYRYEGFEMFDSMVGDIRDDTVRLLFTVQIQRNEPPKREQVAKPIEPNAGSEGATPIQKGKKVGSNDLCPCGSGKKYKKCCGLNEK
ncbi:MAG: SEC-C metal-binding domain-containing protein, partial [Oscillospiraceae bacterium]